MGIPWKRILDVAKGIGGMFIPALPLAIETIEEALPDAKGPDKKAAVESISDAALEAAHLLKGLTEAQVAQIKVARSKAIDTYVAARNAEAQARAAMDEFEDVIASFKKAA